MLVFLFTCIAGGVLGTVPGTAVVAERGAMQRSPVVVTQDVAIKRADVVEVVYLEHVGPYWKLGSAMSQVREQMLKREQTGPLFVRYLDNPLGVAPAELRVEIGFVDSTSLPCEPPFHRIRRDGELVAFMVMEGRAVNPVRDFARILEWVRAHDHRASGPITEVYRLGRPDERTSSWRTEIRVSLAEAPLSSLKNLDHSTAMEFDQRESASSVSVEKPFTPASNSGVGPLPYGRGSVQRLSVEHSAVEPDSLNDSRRSTKPSAEFVLGTKTLGVEKSQAATDSSSKSSIRELFEAKLYDRIALQLMPDDRPIPGSLRVWFGRIVFRLGAVGKGIEKVRPNEGGQVVAMTELILDRYKRVSKGFDSDPLEQAVVRVELENDLRTLDKRAILRDLDTLMGRIAFHSIDVEVVADELATIIQRVDDLLVEP